MTAVESLRWPRCRGHGQPGAILKHLAVNQVPGSGTGPELMAWAGIDAAGIVRAAREFG